MSINELVKKNEDFKLHKGLHNVTLNIFLNLMPFVMCHVCLDNELMPKQLIVIYMYKNNLSKFSTVCFTVFLVIFTNTWLSRHRGS